MGANADRHRQGHEAFRTQDMATLGSLITEDTVWHVVGRGELSGTYKGQDEVFGFLQRINQDSEGTLSLDPIDYTDSDAHSVALLQMSARRGDQSLDTRFVEVIRWQDGVIAERWGLVDDPEAAEAFFS